MKSLALTGAVGRSILGLVTVGSSGVATLASAGSFNEEEERVSGRETSVGGAVASSQVAVVERWSLR